jgi:hypothetical protein
LFQDFDGDPHQNRPLLRHFATPQADPADATALSVRFLLADAMTSANCRATLEGRRLRIEERWKPEGFFS